MGPGTGSAGVLPTPGSVGGAESGGGEDSAGSVDRSAPTSGSDPEGGSSAGAEASGSEAADAEAAGSERVGSEAAGSEAAGAEAVGSGDAGAEAAGAVSEGSGPRSGPGASASSCAHASPAGKRRTPSTKNSMPKMRRAALAVRSSCGQTVCPTLARSPVCGCGRRLHHWLPPPRCPAVGRDSRPLPANIPLRTHHIFRSPLAQPRSRRVACSTTQTGGPR